MPFHPYYTMKDAFAIVRVPDRLFASFVFFAPDYLGHPINYAKANPLVTPAHIVPEWYFLPFYAILRSIPDKLLGVIAMFGSILILFVLPWLDTSPVRSAQLPAGLSSSSSGSWSSTASFSAIVGSNPPEGSWLTIGRIATAYYFLHFLVIMPLIGLLEMPRPVPASISEAVLPPRSEVRAAE